MEDDTKLDNAVVPFTMSKEFLKETQLMLHNGMADVLGIGTGGEVGADFFNQISQLDTLFKNQRWGLLSNQRQLISQMYVEHGLVSTVIDVPVDDAFRGGLDITTKQLTEEELQELQAEIELSAMIEEYAQGVKWRRLYGGGAVMIITDQDPSTPLSTKELQGAEVEFKAIDMWELNNPWFHQHDNDAQLPSEEMPENPEQSVPIERLKLTTKGQCFDYYGEAIHKSRIRIMKGKTPPSFIRPRLRGWGLSELESFVRSINQFLKSTDLTFEVLDEFKLDIFKIKNLKDFMLSPKGKQAISDRVAMANQQKNFQNALTMDSEDDYDHKQLSFTGLAEVMTGIRLQVAMDTKMPMTKIFGMSAAGFNSGEDDIENYNSMVESTIRSKSKSDLLWMVKIKCKQLFGVIPSDLAIAFKPLRVLGAVDEEVVKNHKHTRLLQTQQAGLCSVKEFKDACNKAELLPVKLDTTVDLLDGTGNEFGDESEFEREDRKEEESFARQESSAGSAHQRSEQSAEKGHVRAEESAEKAAEREKANPQKKVDNSFDESKIKRDDEGKFSENGGSSKKSNVSSMARAKLEKKFPYLTIGDFQTVDEKEYSRNEAIMLGKELRAKGNFATIWHMDGPKTGPKSRYIIVKDKEGDSNEK